MTKIPHDAELCHRCAVIYPASHFPMKGARRSKYCTPCTLVCRDLGEALWAKAKPNPKKLKPSKPPAPKGEYEERESWLAAKGLPSYADYLASDLWKDIRKRVYEQKGRKCSICLGDSTELHHQRYGEREMCGTTLKNIHPICRTCHRLIEFDGDVKRPMKIVRAAFDSARDKAGRLNGRSIEQHLGGQKRFKAKPKVKQNAKSPLSIHDVPITPEDRAEINRQKVYGHHWKKRR